MLPKIRVMPHKDPAKRKEYNRAYTEKNRERIYAKQKDRIEKNKQSWIEYHRNYHKKWYEQNKEKRQKQIRHYGKLHKKEAVKATQKYVAKNKEKVYEYGRKYNRTPQGGYRMYKSAALKRNLDFPLSFEDFLEIICNPCRYCGEDSEPIGIDRVDNSLGYIKTNCSPCCSVCNYMKKNYKLQDFIAHAKKIALYNT